jgi:hypothetical protein
MKAPSKEHKPVPSENSTTTFTLFARSNPDYVVLSSSLTLERPVGSIPFTSKTETRMQNCECEDSGDDHGTLEDHERRLVVCQFPGKPVAELDNTVNGPDENQNCCKPQS